MNVFRLGAKLIGHTSPVMLIATGAVLALSLPLIWRRLHAVIVPATATSSGAAGGAKHMDSTTENRLAKTQEADKLSRRTALAATSGALSVAGQAENLRSKIRDTLPEATGSQSPQPETGSFEPPPGESGLLSPANPEFNMPAEIAEDAKPVKRSSSRSVRKKSQ